MQQSASSQHHLTPHVADDLPTLRTAAALQRHQEWVSQESARIPGLLASAGFTLVGDVINPISTGGQAYVAQRGRQAVIAFRGSGGDTLKDTVLNALADAAAIRVKPEEVIGKAKSRVRVHMGFYETYLEFRQAIDARVRALGGAEIYVTGFSMGSALATLTALDLTLNKGIHVTLHGMGTPRVGNASFAELVAAQVPRTLRAVLSADPVPRVPPESASRRGYRHVGGLLVLEEDGAPVPLLRISGRVLSSPQLQAHDRDRYARMIQGLISRMEARAELLRESWGANPLLAAAEAEREPITSPEDDDAY